MASSKVKDMEENQNVNVNEVVDNTTNKNEEVAETKFTQADVDSMISKMYDRWNKQAEKKIKQQQSLVGLDEKERALAEKDIALKELEDKLSQFELAQQKADFTKVLSARGLSAEFIDLIHITDDTVANQQIVDKLDKLFKASVKAEVEKRIGGNTPKTSTIGFDGNITKEQFSKLGYFEKQSVISQNPEYSRYL